MSVEFDDFSGQQNATYARLQQTRQTSGMVAWVMKVTGVDEKKANIILLIVAIVAFSLSFYFIKSTFSPSQSKPVRVAQPRPVSNTQ